MIVPCYAKDGLNQSKFFCQYSLLLKPKIVAQLTFMPLVEDRANLLDDVVVELDEVVGTNLRQESTTILTSF